MTLTELLGFVFGLIGALSAAGISYYADMHVIAKIIAGIIGFISGWGIGIILTKPVLSMITRKYKTDKNDNK